MEPLDLIQEGNIGLLSAVERYQPDVERSFVVIASMCIRHRMIEALHDRDRMVRVPKHVTREAAWMLDEKRQLTEYLGTEPDAAQIAHNMAVPVERVYELCEWSS